jgi:hypothetical protein
VILQWCFLAAAVSAGLTVPAHADMSHIL